MQKGVRTLEPWRKFADFAHMTLETCSLGKEKRKNLCEPFVDYGKRKGGKDTAMNFRMSLLCPVTY